MVVEPEIEESDQMDKERTRGLVNSQLKVINVGLDLFAKDLAQQNVEVVQVDWKPPAGGNPHLAKLLSKLGT